ncbi:hypothetical protein VE23_24570 [Paenibacillus sp. D9]|uniref:hypothetical protein n=1 Tax=Paenibacillus sp. D9 TaxID=665792 RepID=UPI00061F18F8|nr:hypothetical protein [Paenibacillus sp. D9]KKC49492.1 hypothetical protein VE23_24570 [Paenibacillus sp. D9]
MKRPQLTTRNIWITLSMIPLLLALTTLSPQTAIRRDLLFKFQPAAAFSASISGMPAGNLGGDRFFSISKGIDLGTGNPLNGYRLKRYGPLWLIRGVGAP